MTMEKVMMAHGAGGALMQKLIKDYVLKYLGGSNFEVPLEALDDAAVVNGIVLKSDSHTVKPLFFPGGDIGRLAVSGTVNDIAVLGAKPLALTLALILEEGFQLKDLQRIMESIRDTCLEAEVNIVTGDTKVVERGCLEGCVINTSGIGVRSEELETNMRIVRKYRHLDSRWILDSNLRPGDKIILSGSIGDHGIAVLSAREGYGFSSRIISDVKPLNKLVSRILQVGGVTAMKDPTRGGLSNALNEWREKSKVGIYIREEAIPVHPDVQAACEMLGIDPLDVGNEGKLLIGVVPQMAEDVLEELRSMEDGREAQIIGEATNQFKEVVMKTIVGGRRVITPPVGDPIPRIC
ncbi:MAG TPA: hydrogenase expression/formation protein HypE [Candidatus Korarchaeota archaeon]|nr:hydrogenase expression/formation protein HypE [Candidatus Korarchaeota archaeon]